MKKRFGYIYITTNLVDGKKYIGQHAYSEFNENYKGSGIYLQKAIKKHGKENFKAEILEWCYSQKELDEREIYWIDFYQAVESDEFYNLAEGGDGCKKGSKLSEETKKRISESHQGEKHNMYGKHHSEETKKKISDVLSDGRKAGENHPLYGKKWINDGNKNKLIMPDEMEYYLSIGYKKGTIIRKRGSV